MASVDLALFRSLLEDCRDEVGKISNRNLLVLIELALAEVGRLEIMEQIETVPETGRSARRRMRPGGPRRTH